MNYHVVSLISFLGSVGDQLIVDWLSRGGALVILAVAVVAFLRGWIVPGLRYDQCREERDRALELVYKQAEIAQRALDVVKEPR